MKKFVVIVLLLLCSVTNGSNTWVVGGKGTGAAAGPTLGGGYLTGGTATYATCQGTNGAAVTAGVNCTYTHATKNIGKAGIGVGVAVGTLVYISGTNVTTGRYPVTTVTDDDNIICSGIASTDNNTDSTVNVGGALDTTTGLPMDNALGLIDSVIAAGDTVLIPTDASTQRTYAESGNVSFTAGAIQTPVVIKGVKNDGTEITPVRSVCTGGTIANGPLTTTQFPLISLGSNIGFAHGAWTYLMNLNIDGDYATNTMSGPSAGDFCKIINCIVTNSGSGYAYQADDNCQVINCDFFCDDTDNAKWTVDMGDVCQINSCRFTNAGSSGLGLLYCDVTPVVSNCVFYDLTAGDALNVTVTTSPAYVSHCTFYNMPANCITGTNADSSGGTLIVVDSLAVTVTGNFCNNAYAGTEPYNLVAIGNAYYGVTSTKIYPDDHWFINGIQSTGSNFGIGEVTLAGDPFVSAANDDYNLDYDSTAVNATLFKTSIGALTFTPEGGSGMSTSWVGSNP